MDKKIVIEFAVGDVVNFLFAALIIAVLVYLLMFLREAYNLCKLTNALCKNNEVEIDSLIKDSSVIMNKVGKVAESIPDEPLSIVGDLGGMFPMIQSLITFILGLFGSKK